MLILYVGHPIHFAILNAGHHLCRSSALSTYVLSHLKHWLFHTLEILNEGHHTLFHSIG